MDGQNKLLGVMSDHLPEEMIEEILSRLPVKSLLRFRCVSKSWRSLIGSKRFVRKQLENSKRNTTFAHHRAVFSPFNGGGRELFGCPLLSLFSKLDIHALEFNFATTGNIGINSLSLVGTCNGLVCIVLNKREFVLWNPSTRISKKIPNMNMDTHNTPDAYGYGFGCDDDYNYKVVAIFRNQDYSAVYSLKNDSWKRIRNPCNYRVCVDRRGKLESRKLHWEISSSLGEGEEGKIVGLELDLKSEVFEMIEKCEACTFWPLEIFKVYVDDVVTTLPSLAAFTFTNLRYLIIYDHGRAHVSSLYDFEMYLESLETLDTYRQQGQGLKE